MKLLSKIVDKLYVFQEFDLKEKKLSELKLKYFKKVKKEEKKYFGKKEDYKKKNITKMLLKKGSLNEKIFKKYRNFFNSDLYIVFGFSIIKGKILKFLVKKKAINIHMGISPYYRGTDCNFWALYDNNPKLVGATIHLISKRTDAGDILYHVCSSRRKNPFNYTMSTVKGAIISLYKKIQNKSLFKLKPLKQSLTKEIRYSEKKNFTDNIIKKFNKKKINFQTKKKKDKFLFYNLYLYR